MEVEWRRPEKGEEVEEKGIAPESGEEPVGVVAVSRDHGVLAERDRRVLEDRLVVFVVVFSVVTWLARSAHHLGKLLAGVLSGERDPIADVRACIAVGIDEHVVLGAVLKLVG